MSHFVLALCLCVTTSIALVLGEKATPRSERFYDGKDGIGGGTKSVGGSGLSPEIVSNALTWGSQQANNEILREKLSSGAVEKKSAANWHHQIMKPERETLLLAEKGRTLQKATQLLLKGSGDGSQLKADTTVAALEQEDVQGALPTYMCDPTQKYRSATGYCNNIAFPEFGASFRLFRRLIAPMYEDGANEARATGVGGGALPSARNVSRAMHDVLETPDASFTHYLMQWGQFVDHDLDFTPVAAVTLNETSFDCSACDSAAAVSENCLPIAIPAGDDFFPPQVDGQPNCMAFTRSVNAQFSLGNRQQMNQITNYIDASNVYGSTEEKAMALREMVGGRHIVEEHNGEQMLPQTDSDSKCRMDHCAMSGDGRVNVQAGLTSLHTVWMREHNRLVAELAAVNPQWDDETLYQEARRIVGALNQLITYNEFLPRVLGPDVMTQYDLWPLASDFYEGYNGDCDVSISNEFATAAFRFGHAEIASTLHTPSETVDMADVFWIPDRLYDQANYIDDIFRGMSTQPSKHMDRFFSSATGHHLFEKADEPFSGLDLPALNIQRGRDHGLPPYKYYLQGVTDFDSLRGGLMTDDVVDELEAVYEDVGDVDLFTGMLAETDVHGAIVGPTFANVIAAQFRRIRRCDRFWFENANQVGSFTPAQLAELRKMTLAKVICRHLPQMTTVQPQLFDLPTIEGNEPVDCDSLPDMDLSVFAAVPDAFVRCSELNSTTEYCDHFGFCFPVGSVITSSACKKRLLCVESRRGPKVTGGKLKRAQPLTDQCVNCVANGMRSDACDPIYFCEDVAACFVDEDAVPIAPGRLLKKKLPRRVVYDPAACDMA